MGFSNMASPAGRILRIVAGAALIVWGVVSASLTLTVVLIVVGLAPLLAGLFD